MNGGALHCENLDRRWSSGQSCDSLGSCYMFYVSGNMTKCANICVFWEVAWSLG